MSVNAILNLKGRNIITAKPDITINEAVKILNENRIGAIIISADGKKPDGVLSERDVINTIAKNGISAIDNKVSTAMSTPVSTCKAEDSIEVLTTIMTGKKFRHLPVIDENGNLEGMVSIGDVVKRRIDEAEQMISLMSDYISTG